MTDDWYDLAKQMHDEMGMVLPFPPSCPRCEGFHEDDVEDCEEL